MARRPAALDLLLALALGIEMQVELLFADAPPRRPADRARRAARAGRRARHPPPRAGARRRRRLRRPDRARARGRRPVDANLVGPFFATLIVCYSLGAHAEGRQFHAGVAVLVVATPIAIRLDQPPGGAGDFLFVATIVVGGPVLLGRLVRARVKLNQALADKAAAAEDDREARAAGAVAGERARIAGELHHLVSDALASMVAEATAAEQLARTQPDGAELAFGAVEDTGREALGEIRGAARRAAPRGRGAGARAAAVARPRRRPRRARARGGPAGRARRRGRARAAPRRRRPHGLPRRPGGARRRAPGARTRARAAVRLRYADDRARRRGHRRRRRRRPTASARCSACTSASRSTAASWWPSRSTAPATRCGRGCRWRRRVMRPRTFDIAADGVAVLRRRR